MVCTGLSQSATATPGAPSSPKWPPVMTSSLVPPEAPQVRPGTWLSGMIFIIKLFYVA